MGDLTKNISRHEVACKCGCGFDTMDVETIQVLQETCDFFAAAQGLDKVVCHIHSGCRCIPYNRKVGSTDASQHTQGRAIDFSIEGVWQDDVYGYLVWMYKNYYGIGSYDTFTHLDTRTNGPARW